MILTNRVRDYDYDVMVKQLSVSEIQGLVTVTICSADLYYVQHANRSSITQSTESIVSAMGGNELVRYVMAAITKRYVMSIFVGRHSLLNDGLVALPSGTVGFVNLAFLNFVLNLNLNESLADIRMRGYADGNRFILHVPVPVGAGGILNVNPFSPPAGGAPYLEVTSLYELMYHNAVVGPYNFGNHGAPPYEYYRKDVKAYEGTGPSDYFKSTSALVGDLVGHIMIGPVLANLHHNEQVAPTKTHYTTYIPSVGDWTPLSYDLIPTLVRRSISNTHAFDPNLVTDTLNDILPFNACFNETAYVAITRETTSAIYDIIVGTVLIALATQTTHPIAGNESEYSMSLESIVKQHMGGGFMDFFKSTGVPVLSGLLGSVADAYMPGTGGLVRGMGNSLGGLIKAKPPDRGILVQAIKYAHKHSPWSPLLRPSSWNGHSTSYVSGVSYL